MKTYSEVKLTDYGMAVALAQLLNEKLAGSTPQQRLDLIYDAMYGYCKHCGNEQPPQGQCQCWNDE